MVYVYILLLGLCFWGFDAVIDYVVTNPENQPIWDFLWFDISTNEVLTRSLDIILIIGSSREFVHEFGFR